MSVIGQYIKKYQTARGITQEQLGQLVGVSTQAVSKWECGGTPDAQTRPWARIMHDSNVNYTLLAYVVEQVSGMAYEDFIRQNIFEPLGMTHSGFFGEVPENPQWGLTYDNLVSSSNFIYFNAEYGYNLFIATPNTPEFAQSMIARLTADFINILFKAVDAAAQQ